jgi:hypothetical protein
MKLKEMTVRAGEQGRRELSRAVEFVVDDVDYRDRCPSSAELDRSRH